MQFHERVRQKVKRRLERGSVLFAIPAWIERWRGSVVEVDGVRLRMDRGISNFMARVLRSGEHAREERELVLPALEPDDVVMELGGGVGHLSTRIAKVIGSERVFTFEANPELEPMMRENHRLNGVCPTVEFCVLGHREGVEAFYVRKHFWSSSQIPGAGARRVEVPMHPVNERIRSIDPSFLIVDIEGGERTVFDGLDFANVRKLMLELHTRELGADEAARILGLIAAAGFELDRKQGRCLLFRRDPSRPGPSVGDGIPARRGGWRFDGIVPAKFDGHVSRSIPGYAAGHDRVAERLGPCLAEGGLCYELGCSTGVLTEKLGRACPTARVIGVDQVPGMLERARSRCGGQAHVSFERADLVGYRFSPARAVVSYYTLHFVPLAERVALVQRIFSALEPGGLFLLFEKVRNPDPAIDREWTQAYHAFKESQGFTRVEIDAKAAALDGVLVPRTEAENLTMLTDAGFAKVEKVFQELCWQGYVAEQMGGMSGSSFSGSAAGG